MAIIDTFRMDLKNNDGYFVSIKSLCFESGSGNYEPGQKHSSFFIKNLLWPNGHISSHFQTIRLKL